MQSSPPVSADARQGRSVALDVLRIFAAAWVVAYHWAVNGGDYDSIPGWLAGFFGAGYLGVDIFFLLSGAVIAHSAMNRSWSDFGKSRFLRLFPVFFATAAMVALVRLVRGVNEWGPETLIELTGLNLWMGDRVGLLVGPSWTLLYEVQFYALIALAIFLAKNRLTERTILLGSSLFLVAWLFARTTQFPVLIALTLYDFGPLFIAGALLGITRTRASLRTNGLAILVAVACSVYTLMLRTAEMGVSGYVQLFWVVAVLGVSLAFILWSSLRRPTGRPQTRAARAIQTLSLMTYPIYLLHLEIGLNVVLILRAFELDNPAFAALSYLAGLALVIVLSWLSVKWFEPRARALLRRAFGWDRPAPVPPARANPDDHALSHGDVR